MDQGAKEILESLDEELRKLQDKNFDVVMIDPFRKLLGDMLSKLPKDSGARPALDAAQLEHYKTQLSLHADTVRQNHEWSIKQYEIVLSTASTALKTAMLLSGGAAVAMMSFVSSMTSKKADLTAAAIDGMSDSVVAFFAAVFLAAFATAGTYFAQYCYSQKNYQPPAPPEEPAQTEGNPDPIRTPREIWEEIKRFANKLYAPRDYQRRGDQVRWFTWILGVGSYAACAVGGWYAKSAVEIVLSLPNAL